MNAKTRQSAKKIRDTKFFRAWQFQDGSIIYQRKRLPKATVQKIHEAFGEDVGQKLIELTPKGSIPMCGLLRSVYSWTLHECRDRLSEHNLWSPNWPSWQIRY